MASTPTYPGVYIRELTSPVHTIAGVATSIAAFVGYTAKGIDNRAEHIFDFSDFERYFGGLASDSELSYAVQQFFSNGGTEAYVVRTPRTGATGAQVVFNSITFTALSSGSWADGQLLLDVDYTGIDHTADATAFNLTITDLQDGTTEFFPQLSLKNTQSNYITAIINDPDNGSQLVKAAVSGSPAGAPVVTGIVGATITNAAVNTALGGGTAVATDDFGVTISVSSPSTAPAPLPLTVKVFSSGSPLPQSLAGLAAQLQTTANNALAIQMPGASIQASVAPTATGSGIRVNALLPQAPDAVVTITAPTSGPKDAAGPLGLTAPFSTNVAHYALGTGNGTGTNAWGGSQTSSTAGKPGTGLPATGDLIGDPGSFTGIYALQKVGLFNLLSIPDATRANPSDPNALDTTVDPNAIYSAAITLCDTMSAFLLIDSPPNVNTVSGAVDWKSSGLSVVDENGAAFFPRLRLPDPLNNYQLRTFAPSGVVAGLYARIDSTRGVWKAPAGTEATLTGVQSLVYKLSDAEQGALNPLGLNCFRTFPVYGTVLWGARTLLGADAQASQWKYVPVRRLALFLEVSLYRGTQWVVFEPNDEPLWGQIRLNVGSFMQDMFRKGAFQGQTPADAYFVKCDSSTTTQNDIDQGIVNILVGFAPLKPAEFVIIQIQQMAGQIQS
jgi:phage tail sheath protein FI